MPARHARIADGSRGRRPPDSVFGAGPRLCLRAIGRVAARGLALACALSVAARSDADEIVLTTGESRSGEVTAIDGLQLQLREAESTDPTSFHVEDLRSVRLSTPITSATTLVVENDGGGSAREKSGKIKLQEGFHKFYLPYWHDSGTAVLQFEFEGPGLVRTAVSREHLFSLSSDELNDQPSPGLTADGVRQPDQPGKTENRCMHRLHEWDHSGDVRGVADIRKTELIRRGPLPNVRAQLPHHNGPFGVVFWGYLRVATAGEYTFHLKSDGGSCLFLGEPPSSLLPEVPAVKPGAWTVETRQRGRLTGALKSWDDESVTVGLEFSTSGVSAPVPVPVAQLKALWKKLDNQDAKLKIDRDGEPTDVDVVYAKGNGDQVQRVTGRVMGIDDGSLRFVYDDQERKIKLDRVLGIVRAASSEPASDEPHFLARLPGGQCVPVRCRALAGEQAALETLWGAAVELPREAVAELEVVNGRMRWLSDLSPARVEHTPWFDRMIEYAVDKSPTGGSLRIGERDYVHGLCLHSKTVITYDLAGAYELLRADLGIQRPEGEFGDAAVRWLLDGQVVWERPSLTAKDESQTLDLDLSGRQTLVVEVDFGANFDIGDYVTLGNVYLLRAAAGPAAAGTASAE